MKMILVKPHQKFPLTHNKKVNAFLAKSKKKKTNKKNKVYFFRSNNFYAVNFNFKWYLTVGNRQEKNQRMSECMIQKK